MCIQNNTLDSLWHIRLTLRFIQNMWIIYSPFHSSLPYLSQSSLCVNQVTFYSISELKLCPGARTGILKTYSTLSLGNVVTSSDKVIVISWLKHFFYFKILCTAQTIHIENIHLKKDMDKSRILAVTYR